MRNEKEIVSVEIQERLDCITAEIVTIREQVKAFTLQAAIQTGKRLLEAKNLCSRGSWGEYLNRLDYSERTAQNAMKLYEEYGGKESPQALADLNYTQAVILLGLEPGEREQFAEENQVNSMSTRQLQAAVDVLKAEKAKMQLTIDELMTSAGKDESEAIVEEMRARVNETEDKLKAAKEAAKLAQDCRGKDLAELTERNKKVSKLEKELKEAKKQVQEAAAQAEKKAAAASAEAEKLRQELKEAEKPVIQQVTPPEVEEELKRLRERAGRGEAEMKVRIAYDRLKAEFEQLMLCLGNLAAADMEAAAKYRAAFGRAMWAMKGTVEG